MIENLVEIAKNCGVFELGIVDTKNVNFSNEVRKMCEVNTCKQYGKTWACPPAVGTVEECKQRCYNYKKMLVFSSKFELEDSFDYEGMVNGLTSFKNVARKLEASLKSELKEFLTLSNEGCDICEKCTYPDNPCRFPDRAHGSLEGYGIFVNELANMANINYINGVNTVTYFGAILFNN